MIMICSCLLTVTLPPVMRLCSTNSAVNNVDNKSTGSTACLNDPRVHMKSIDDVCLLLQNLIDMFKTYPIPDLSKQKGLSFEELQRIENMLYSQERMIEGLHNEIIVLFADLMQKFIGTVPTISSMATAFGAVETKLEDLTNTLTIPVISAINGQRKKARLDSN
eukprot:Lankesteria_metandrocarpae@DN5370_c0_g1_i1.p1